MSVAEESYKSMSKTENELSSSKTVKAFPKKSLSWSFVAATTSEQHSKQSKEITTRDVMTT